MPRFLVVTLPACVRSKAMLQAARLAQSAAASLQFQSHEAAVANLSKALELLTLPTPPDSSE